MATIRNLIYILSSLSITTSVSAASGLLKEQVAAYKKLSGSDVLTTEALLKLLILHDDDTVCVGACQRHVEQFVGPKGMEFSRLENILDTIYGDQISEDPWDSQEVHLALGESLSEMKVMWASKSSLANPFVEYTAAANEWGESTTIISQGTNHTYSVPSNWYPGWAGMIYEANMEELAVGKQQYKYRVGGYDTDGVAHRSQDFLFNTPPEPSPEQKTVVATLGDQGTFMLLGFTAANKLIELQDELGVDIVHHAGDLSYAGLSGDLTPFNDIDDKDEFGHIWDLWGIQNEPIAATRPYMTTPGNHESFYNWTAFSNRYHMPHEKSGGNENFWWSYDYGNMHMVSISTEHCFESGCSQMEWLNADLEKAVANRANVPWIIMSIHRPMYCSEDGSNAPGNQYQTAMEPLMLQYDVDLVLQGHMHAYERIHPVNNGEVTVQPSKIPAHEVSELDAIKNRPRPSLGVDVYESQGKGPVYVVQGNTGAMQFERWENPQPDWSAIRFANGYIPPRDHASLEGSQQLKGLVLDSNYTDTFGVGIMTLYNSTHMYYRNYPVSGTIGVDEFWVVKRT